jgi:MoxR-like ATPase
MEESEVVAERVVGFRRAFGALEAELGRVVVGQRETVRGLLTALFAGGHVLLEGAPGLGKTLLVRTLGAVTGLQFSRVQFTPDLMPADIVGTSLIFDDGGTKRFQFQPGPVFTNILLADEINRATPKTQSALLEAMQERHATVGGETREVPDPFLVLATQNPLEMEGTYPLPEAQLDRFLLKLLVGFPSEDELHAILDRTTAGADDSARVAATSADELRSNQRLIREVPIVREVQAEAVRLVMATHPEASAGKSARRFVRYGASPRGAQALVLCAKIEALLAGRYHVAREDIRAVAMPALRHRIVMNFEGEAEGVTPDDVVREALG